MREVDVGIRVAFLLSDRRVGRSLMKNVRVPPYLWPKGNLTFGSAFSFTSIWFSLRSLCAFAPLR